MREGIHNHLAAFLEHFDLAQGELVFIGIVGRSQVREHALHVDEWVSLEATDQLGQFFQGEAQAVHARIEFHVDVQRGCDAW